MGVVAFYAAVRMHACSGACSVSSNARDFQRLRLWCEWQFELPLSPSWEARLLEDWAKVRRDAAYIIGWQA
jgi:hypothetical protein